MDGTGFSDITEDLVENILTRLPVKSLKRLSCVNKWWYNLIHSPYFISRHYSHHSSFNHKLLVKFCELSDTPIPISNNYVDSIVSVNDGDCSYLSLPFLNQDNSIYTIGPCINGIICLGISTGYHVLDDIALWNVATGEYDIFPKLQLSIPPKAYLQTCMEGIGFGWVPDTNEYKVVMSIDFWEDNDYHHDCIPYYGDRPLFFVYTLGTDSWKTLSLEIPYCASYIASAPPNNSQTYVNGVCYWVHQALDGMYNILSFHVRDEVFGSLPMPHIENPNRGYLGLTLHMLDGYIALLHTQFDAESSPFLFDIWVMEESWTKKFTIEALNIHAELGIVKDELFLEDKSGHLLSIDIYSQEIKDLGKKGSESHIQVLEYVESLVILKRQL